MVPCLGNVKVRSYVYWSETGEGEGEEGWDEDGIMYLKVMGHS